MQAKKILGFHYQAEKMNESVIQFSLRKKSMQYNDGKAFAM